MKRLVAGALALTLLSGTAAMAAPGNYGPQPQHQQFARNDHNDHHRHHRWSKGNRLPHAHGRVISDWRGHHLRRPPHGYHWVEADGDYVLAAVATGIILQVILNNN